MTKTQAKSSKRIHYSTTGKTGPRGGKNAQDLFAECVHASKPIHCVQLSLTTDSRTSEVTAFITCSFSLEDLYLMGLS